VSRRTRALSLASGIALVLAVVALLLPVPYVALGPGETDDTLGADPRAGAVQVLQVTGATTYPTSGELRLTTVSVVDPLDLGQALLRWVERPYAVVPRSVVYPPQKKQSEVDAQNQQDMKVSQDDATVAALGELTPPKVGAFSDGSKAAPALRVGDVITGVDGTAVTNLAALRALVASLAPGATARVTVRRDGVAQDASVTTIGVTEGRATRTILGITPDTSSPVKVTINLSNVGGPSAGLMFALGILDKLTPGSLTGGRVIAGTGTISPTGDVGLIGGIQQKLQGARHPGRDGQRPATVFLVPEQNCQEAVAAHVGGLQLVKVPQTGGLDAAYSDLQRLARGDTALAAC